MDFSKEEVLQIGERIYNMERIYNLAAGVGPDVLPDRLFEEDLEDGQEGGGRIDRGEFEDALASYYQKRGWDPSGAPGEAKRRELGLA
jgi:aldehyde:ferredoxin oxidoreductase